MTADDDLRLRGELQVQIMAVLWGREAATVEQTRVALPPRYRSSYTTIQTVMNRLADRGLLSRERSAGVIVYRARLSEADVLARTVEQALAGASREARRIVIAQLAGELQGDDRAGVAELARDVAKKRRQRK